MQGKPFFRLEIMNKRLVKHKNYLLILLAAECTNSFCLCGKKRNYTVSWFIFWM